MHRIPPVLFLHALKNPLTEVTSSRIPSCEDRMRGIMETTIRQIENPDEKARIARHVLAALPEWFGIPESTEEYITQSRKMPFWAAYPVLKRNVAVATGFLALKETSPHTAEIYVMGVLPEYHRQGVGRQLFEAFEEYARKKSYSFLQVKTVQEGHYVEYDRTNRFYRALGFRELECFPTLWDECNPCQILVKSVNDCIPACSQSSSVVHYH